MNPVNSSSSTTLQLCTHDLLFSRSFERVRENPADINEHLHCQLNYVLCAEQLRTTALNRHTVQLCKKPNYITMHNAYTDYFNEYCKFVEMESHILKFIAGNLKEISSNDKFTLSARLIISHLKGLKKTPISCIGFLQCALSSASNDPR